MHEHAKLVGFIAMRWTLAELMFQWLVHAYLRSPLDQATAITTHLGDRTLYDILLALARLEGNEEALRHVEHAVKVNDANRVNRNYFVHGHYFGLPKTDGTTEILNVRTTARGKLNTQAHQMELRQLKEVIQEIEDFIGYLSQLVAALRANLAGTPAPWPHKLAVPVLRTMNPQWHPASAPPPPS